MVKSYLRFFAAIAFLVTANSCVYTIPPSVLKDVERGITFEVLKQDPEAYIGKAVILGGNIIETKVLKEGTEIEVLHRPLSYDDQPSETGASAGRFIIIQKEFMDPIIFKPGRPITVVGEVSGKQIRPLGERDYMYPVITARQVYLWRRAEPSYYRYPYPSPYYWDPYWCWDPYWGYYRCGYPYWYNYPVPVPVPEEQAPPSPSREREFKK